MQRGFFVHAFTVDRAHLEVRNDPWLPSLGRLVMSYAVTRELMAPMVCRASGRDLTPFFFCCLGPFGCLFFTVSRRLSTVHTCGRCKNEDRKPKVGGKGPQSVRGLPTPVLSFRWPLRSEQQGVVHDVRMQSVPRVDRRFPRAFLLRVFSSCLSLTQRARQPQPMLLGRLLWGTQGKCKHMPLYILSSLANTEHKNGPKAGPL